MSEIYWEKAYSGDGIGSSLAAMYCNPKKPYGNCSFEQPFKELFKKAGLEYSLERLTKFHKETVTAIKVVFDTKSFKLGTYVRSGESLTSLSKWRKKC